MSGPWFCNWSWGLVLDPDNLEGLVLGLDVGFECLVLGSGIGLEGLVLDPGYLEGLVLGLDVGFECLVLGSGIGLEGLLIDTGCLEDLFLGLDVGFECLVLGSAIGLGVWSLVLAGLVGLLILGACLGLEP